MLRNLVDDVLEGQHSLMTYHFGSAWSFDSDVNRLSSKYIKWQFKEFVLDFENAVWWAMTDIFENSVKLFCCGFHWAQCAFRRMKKIWLSSAHNRKSSAVYILFFMISSHAFIWHNSNPTFYLQETYVPQPPPRRKCCVSSNQFDLLRNSVHDLISDRL